MLVITDQRRFLAENGTAALPSFTFASDTGTGFRRIAAGEITFTGSGVDTLRVHANSLTLRSVAAYTWGSGEIGTAQDLLLFRDAAGTLAQRNGTNAQVFKVYNTFTDASNYERSFIGFGGNRLFFATERGGTGVERDVEIRGASIHFSSLGGSRWLINATGHFIASTDNSFDIGASGANRPRNIYFGSNLFGGDIQAGGGNFIRWASSSMMKAPSDGVIKLSNGSETTFNRLQLGGTTSSFPAIKRNSAEMQAVLADDSGFTAIQGIIKTHANAVAETPSASHTITIQDASGTSYKVLCVPA
jgi:hypothetical protein